MNVNKYKKDIRIEMPQAVKSIIERLGAAGYEAFAVGGCVRDSIIGKEPKDWDITTSAKPEEVKEIFPKTIDTGIQHGTVTVMISGEGYEVTTYRVDGEYEDGRHPKEVAFTSNLEEDLKRRDFTINAMAYNEQCGVADLFGGVEDLNSGVIRCVGVAEERFTEDALRMLRALRFSAVLDFEIDKDTKDAIKKLAPNIEKISRERIQVELDKLIMSEHPDRVTELYDTELINYIFAGKMKKTDVSDGKKLARLLSKSPKEHYIRWAIFISCVPCENLLRSLKFDNATIKICNKMYQHLELDLPEDDAQLRKMAVLIGKEIFDSYLTYRAVMKIAEAERIFKIQARFREILDRKDCLCIKELAINGEDLRSIGIEQGKKMGEVLNTLFDMVLEDYTANTRKRLLEEASKIK